MAIGQRNTRQRRRNALVDHRQYAGESGQSSHEQIDQGRSGLRDQQCAGFSHHRQDSQTEAKEHHEERAAELGL